MIKKLDDFLKNIQLSDHFSLQYHDIPKGGDVAVINENIVPDGFGQRAITTARFSFVTVFAKGEAIATAKLARKIISEWALHDRCPKKTPMRNLAIRSLDQYLAGVGEKPVPAGKKGAWLTAPPQTSESPDVERTIILALIAFQKMLAGKTLLVSRKA